MLKCMCQQRVHCDENCHKLTSDSQFTFWAHNVPNLFKFLTVWLKDKFTFSTSPINTIFLRAQLRWYEKYCDWKQRCLSYKIPGALPYTLCQTPKVHCSRDSCPCQHWKAFLATSLFQGLHGPHPIRWQGKLWHLIIAELRGHLSSDFKS